MHNQHPVTLLFGMPRSGTTWIGKVFDSHPNVNYRHEPDSEYVLNDFMGLYPDTVDVARYRDAVRKYCRNHLQLCRVRICGKMPMFPKQGLSSFALLKQKSMVVMAKLIEHVFGKDIEWEFELKNSRIVWKSIESLGRIGVILPSVPDCNGVIIQRDPCGYVASVLRGERLGRFSAGESITEDWNIFEMLLATPYAKQLGLSLGKLRLESPIERLAWIWILVNQKACDDISDRPNVCIVRYEDLCRKPKEGFQQLFAFCELTWNEQTERFIEYSTNTKHNDSYYSVVKNPLKAAYRWRDELDDKEVDIVKNIVEQHPIGQAYYGADSHYPIMDI